MGKEFDINIESKISKIFDRRTRSQMIKANNKYLAIFSSSINIYELKQNLEMNYKNSIICDKIISYIDLHPLYPEIILSSFCDGIIKIWKIPESNNNDIKEEISTIKAHNSYVHYSLFNPVFENLIISSDSNNIKLWDIT